MESITEFLVIRHGETEWNVQGRCQGHEDVPLSNKGIKQAKDATPRLNGQKFHCLYSSDLSRTRETAEIIGATVGNSVIIDERLRERNFGIFQGTTRSERESQFPEDFLLNDGSNPDYVIPEGESVRQLFDRTVSYFNELAEKHQRESIIVVTHSGVIRSLYRYVEKIPLTTQTKFRFSNVSFQYFTAHNQEWKLKSTEGMELLQ